MDEHRRRIIAFDGTYIFDQASGFYEREERDEPLPYRGPIMVAGAILAWALFLGIAYCAWRALETLAS